MTDLLAILEQVIGAPLPRERPPVDYAADEQMAALVEGRVVVIGGRPRQLDTHGEWGQP